MGKTLWGNVETPGETCGNTSGNGWKQLRNRGNIILRESPTGI